MTVGTLPEGYRLVRRVDLAREKKLALLINGIAVVIAALMVGIGLIIRPVTGLLDFDKLLHALYVLVGVAVYVVLHELIHALFMKLFAGAQTEVKFGFTAVYPYAGAPHTYFSRPHYVAVAFAPVLLLGVALLALNIALPSLFWYIYFVQIINISGASGDFYMIWLMYRRMPADVLINDTGVSMTLYSAAEGPFNAKRKGKGKVKRG